jgi:hypothetical protein
MYIVENLAIFIHIPKTGGNSMNYVLNKKYKNIISEENNRKYFHEDIETALTLVKNPDKYLKFTIVRHPITRIWSNYNYNIKPKKFRKINQANIVPKQQQYYYREFYDNYKYPSLSKFCKMIDYHYNKYQNHKNTYKIKYGTLDGFDRYYYDLGVKESSFKTENYDGQSFIFSPQLFFITDSNNTLKVDNILRLENIKKEFKPIQKKLKLDNFSHQNANIVPEYDIKLIQQLSKKHRQKIHEMLRMDFEYFGYGINNYSTINL